MPRTTTCGPSFIPAAYQPTGPWNSSVDLGLDRDGQRMARGGVLDLDAVGTPAISRLMARLTSRVVMPLAVDDGRRRHRSHQRTSLACSSRGTSAGSGKTRRIAISSDDSTTRSSFSAYSSGLVANWSRARPTPWAVEIR